MSLPPMLFSFNGISTNLFTVVNQDDVFFFFFKVNVLSKSTPDWKVCLQINIMVDVFKILDNRTEILYNCLSLHLAVLHVAHVMTKGCVGPQRAAVFLNSQGDPHERYNHTEWNLTILDLSLVSVTKWPIPNHSLDCEHELPFLFLFLYFCGKVGGMIHEIQKLTSII